EHVVAALAKRADDFINPELIVSDRVSGEPDTQSPAECVAEFSHREFERIERAIQLLERLVDGPSLVGQPEAALAALTDLEAEPLLKRLHVGAYNRGADVQGELRAAKSMVLDDGSKHLERLQVRIAETHRPPSPS